MYATLSVSVDNSVRYKSSSQSRYVCRRAKRHIQSSSARQVALCLSSLVGVRHHIRYTAHRGIRPSRCSARPVWPQWPYSDPTRRGRRRQTVRMHKVQRTSRQDKTNVYCNYGSQEAGLVKQTTYNEQYRHNYGTIKTRDIKYTLCNTQFTT